MPTPRESYCIGYKVVLNIGFRLVSSWANGLIYRLDSGRVEYAIGKRTRPNAGCGPLAVFGNSEDAKDYINRNSDRFFGMARIYRCKYRKSNQTKMFALGYSGCRIYENPPLLLWPSSMLATWVELIEEV